MSKKYLVIALSAIAFVGCVLTFGGHARNLRARNSGPTGVPEFVPYMFLFNHHEFNLQKAAELDRQSKNGAGYRSMEKRLAGLTDQEAVVLDQVTADCERELEKQDERAREVINAFRARFPPGRLPEGVLLPPPPAELTQMQEERNAIILRARDRLHEAFGDESFKRLDSFVKSQVASDVQLAP